MPRKNGRRLAMGAMVLAVHCLVLTTTTVMATNDQVVLVKDTFEPLRDSSQGQPSVQDPDTLFILDHHNDDTSTDTDTLALEAQAQKDRQWLQAQLWPSQPPIPSEPRHVGLSEAPNTTWHLWYRQPAATKSVEEGGFLIGHGKGQVLIGGGINVERLIFNEESCWSGGPGEETEYHGGNVPEEEGPHQQEVLRQFRMALAEKRVVKAGSPIVEGLRGKGGRAGAGFGKQERFGEVVVEELHPFEQVRNYRRELDLGQGVVRVTFSVGEVDYTREHFCSFLESVCVMRVQASEPKSINLKVSLKTEHEVEYTNVHNRLGLHGQLVSNNLTIDAQVAIKAEGSSGVSMSNNRQVVAMNFDVVTLYYAFGTGWTAEKFPIFEDVNPHDRLVTLVDKALGQFYADQYLKHIKDHQGLFDAFGLDFGQEPNVLPTDELLKAVKKGEAGDSEESYLDGLLLQYGRYLLIASSRPGSLPLSGQSVWSSVEGDDDTPGTRYKFNIDLQMNYWLAESTGLGETVGPLIDYMEKLLMPRGQGTASLHHNARGWTTYTYSNIWGHTGPVDDSPTSFYFPVAAAWLCQHAWDRYLYSQDYYYLRDHAYKLMKGASQFWLDTLIRYQGTGPFVSSPSYSPQHGPFTEGSALDQQLIWQLLNQTLEAIAVIGERDKVFVQNLTETLSKLSRGIKIGQWGQLQEWNLDIDEPNEGHRFLGPFYAVYPGNQIFVEEQGLSIEDDQLRREESLAAAKEALLRRGVGMTEGNLGWPKVWRSAVWARLEEGGRAYEGLELFKQENLERMNLLDFGEMSGLFGYGAAMVEMVIQSRQVGSLEVMVCFEGLPERWLKRGEVGGFRSKEGHQVGVSWVQGKVKELELVAALKGGNVEVRIGTLKGEDEEEEGDAVMVVVKGSNKEVPFTRVGRKVSWVVAKGQTYVLQINP